jgi:small subunit ribosomal protein S6
MREYETTFVLAPTLSEEEVEETVTGFTGVAEEKGAKVVNVDNWGKRRLAFPVKKHEDGFYVVLTLQEETVEAVTELERRFKVSDSVIRFLSIRVDEELRRAENARLRRERRSKKSSEKTDEKAEADKPASEDLQG